MVRETSDVTREGSLQYMGVTLVGTGRAEARRRHEGVSGVSSS